MQGKAEDSGIVQVETSELPVLAVHVLERLGYRVNRHSKRVNEIIASAQLNEQIGRDWFRSDYQVILAFKQGSVGSIINVEVADRAGGSSSVDCQKRCDQIIVCLQDDAIRAGSMAGQRQKSTLYGSAQWGTEDDLRVAGYLTETAQAQKLIIGKATGGEYISVPELSTYKHAMVVGRTGVGKTSGFFIPNIVERLGVNMIITEATPDYGPGELYKLTAGWRKHAGHQVFSFNPSVMSSVRLNPIDRVRNAPREFKALEAARLAELLVLNGERKGTKTDPAFDRSETHLLLSLILHCANCEPEIGHFGALRWLMLSGLEAIQQTMRRSGSEIAQMEFEGWLANTKEGFRYSVTGGLLTKLNPWLTDQMIVLTEKTDVDFEALVNQLFTFYVAVPSRSKDSKLVGSLMVNYLLNFILDTGAHMKYRTSIMLDEFTNFGKIANIEDTLSIIRKARVGLVMGFQNYSQLEDLYGRNGAQTICDMPATQVFFQQKKYQEAKTLSDALGRMTVEETTVNDSGRVMDSVTGRALATPDELIRLERQCIIFTDATAPLKVPVIPPGAYDHALAYPAPEQAEHQVTDFIKNRGGLVEVRRENEKTTAPLPKKQNSINREPQKQRPDDKKEPEKKPHDGELKKKPPEERDIGDVWS